MELTSPALYMPPAASLPAINALAGQTPGQSAEDAARRTAMEFEAVYLSQMLEPMFEGIGEDPLFGGGPGEDIYRSLLVEEYGKAMAQTGGIGIADAVYREILKLQEVSQP